MEIQEKKLKFNDTDLLYLFGYDDSFLNIIENKFQTIITVRGNNVILKGNSNEIKAIESILNELVYTLKRKGALNIEDVTSAIALVEIPQLPKNDEKKEQNGEDSVIFQGYKDSIRAKTPKQFDYYKKVLENDLCFAIGPAGTGKTFLAVAMALDSLKKNEVSKIILSRPAVEAGESLGFLPGDLKEKIDPYLRPLTDALYYMLNAEKCKNMMEKNIIEIIPLAYMRGRTLNNSFIILDEAQNATITQMKMFLTRLGFNSKAIITGDITQIDLPSKDNSGLINAKNILKRIKGIEFVYFDNTDVVRHRLVSEIIKAYEMDANKKFKEFEEKKELKDLFNENSIETKNEII
jgi:phosphate starvation-inducible protein PhoH and related proteins